MQTLPGPGFGLSHTTRRSAWVGMIFLWLLISCTGPSPAAQEQITSLRILAIQVSPPTALPGTEIKLKALVASPWIKPITYQWYACQAQRDLNEGCAGRDDAVSLGQGETATYEVPKDFLPAKPSALEAFRGRYLPITLVAKAGPHQEIATKRVVVALLQSNKNPTIQELQLYQGEQKTPLIAPWQLSPGARCELRPLVPKESREMYTTVDTKGNLHQVQEELFFSWYITGGSLQGGRSSDADKPNKIWRLPQTLPAETKDKAHIYLILRDGRGGVDWKHHTLQLKR